MLESKRGDDIRHGLEGTCHSWLLGVEGGNNKGEKEQEEQKGPKQMCSGSQIAGSLQKVPSPTTTLSKRKGPTLAPTRSEALGVGLIHFLKSSTPTHPASLPPCFCTWKLGFLRGLEDLSFRALPHHCPPYSHTRPGSPWFLPAVA